MKLELFLRFSTQPGQNLKVFGNSPSLGSGAVEKAIPMSYVNHHFWHVAIEIENDALHHESQLQYSYLLEDNQGIQIQDWGKHRSIHIHQGLTGLSILDTWNHMGATENTFFTSPFSQIYLKQNRDIHPLPKLSKKLRFTTVAPLLPENESLCILGSVKELGSWSPSEAIPMQFNGHEWFVDVETSGYLNIIEYKYGFLNANGLFSRFEDGNNRSFRQLPAIKDSLLVQDCFVRMNNTDWKGAGIAVPVFSLRSEQSLGVGEFTDIKKLVDWAEKVSLKMVQLLPVNDTTCTHSYLDSYPYAAISAFALHPLYANISAIAGKKYAEKLKPFISKRDALNQLIGVDYDAVMKLKWEALNILYTQLHQEIFASADYQSFFSQNQYWLVPYAAYSYLRDLNGKAEPSTWGKYAVYNASVIEELTSAHSEHFNQIALHYFIQYHLHCQLKDAHDYANERGILLKGDIAIGVHKNGVDAWMQPEIYHLDMQAGAPPDDFAVSGQNWGFPTYNWKTMKEDGYAWWKQRFKQMSYYFDAFRIDHILGFFRIWSIPSHAVEGIMGHFVPAIPVHLHEFSQRGIWFDLDRFCKPYITKEIIWEMAGERTPEIHHFLRNYDGIYVFKEEFDTQRKLEAYFNALDQVDDNHTLKQILYNLHSNVILWKDPSTHDQFHFRFNAADTLSYKHLDDHAKHQLWELYVDYFFKRQDEIWREEALEKLPALKRSTDMLVCGEDLGLVPACVPGVMSGMGFLSMEVQRMPKQLNINFFNPATAPYLSVVTPSTHDMSTIREWWEEDRQKSQQFYNEQLGQHGSAPHYAETHIVRSVILQHLWSPAMWSIFQLQDLFAMHENLRVELPSDERINIPGDSKHYWRFRMNKNIEDLLQEDTFNEELKRLITQAGR